MGRDVQLCSSFLMTGCFCRLACLGFFCLIDERAFCGLCWEPGFIFISYILYL